MCRFDTVFYTIHPTLLNQSTDICVEKERKRPQEFMEIYMS